jgi:putative solute:sodium symporter small subunit
MKHLAGRAARARRLQRTSDSAAPIGAAWRTGSARSTAGCGEGCACMRACVQVAASIRCLQEMKTMQLTQRHEEYWRRNLRITAILLSIWFVVTFVASYFARELNEIVIFGFPLGFYMGAQGALIVYVVIIGFYARYMNRLDKEYGVSEGDEE